MMTQVQIDDRGVDCSQYFGDEDEDEESIDALIKRYAGERQQLNQADLDKDDVGRNKLADDDDDYDDVISKPIVRLKLQPFEAPEFDQRLRGYNEICVGESVTFVAQFRAFPAPTVKWFKDEEEVRATERHLLESSWSECVGIIRLIINDVRATDEGAYKCKVENQEGVASTTGYLSVSGGEARSRRTTRTTSSRSSKLSPGSTISSPSRSPGVSTPPILRPITEQKSIEEKEELELSRQPPSPLQAFIDSIRHSAKSRHPPIFYGSEQVIDTGDDENGGDDEEDVFDSEEDSVSQTTSIDCLEQLLAISLTSTGDDPELCGSPIAVMSRPTFVTPSINSNSMVPTTAFPPAADTQYHTSTMGDSFQQHEAELTHDRLNSAMPTGVTDCSKPSSATPTSGLKSTQFESDRHSSLTFHQRRLGQLQLKHRLAIDLPDYLSSTSLLPPLSSDKTLASDSGSDYDNTASVSVTDASSLSASSCSPSAESSCCFALSDTLRVIQDSVLTIFDNPVARFYIVFVAVTSVIANTFDVQPLWLVLVVAAVSFVSFQLFEHHHCHKPDVLSFTKYPTSLSSSFIVRVIDK